MYFYKFRAACMRKEERKKKNRKKKCKVVTKSNVNGPRFNRVVSATQIRRWSHENTLSAWTNNVTYSFMGKRPEPSAQTVSSFKGVEVRGHVLAPIGSLYPQQQPRDKAVDRAISPFQKINDNIHQHVSSTRRQAGKPRFSRVCSFSAAFLDTDVTQLRGRHNGVFR